MCARVDLHVLHVCTSLHAHCVKTPQVSDIKKIILLITVETRIKTKVWNYSRSARDNDVLRTRRLLQPGCLGYLWMTHQPFGGELCRINFDVS